MISPPATALAPVETCEPHCGPGRGASVLALLTAMLVFPLIFVGAGVTSKDAGLAYPDWPTSGGHLLTDPPNWWQSDDTRWEHGHRRIGQAVGLLAIGLAVASWRSRGAVRAVGIATLAAICIQGLLGGVRVTEKSTDLALVHGIWGQACFCLACTAALITSPTWRRPREKVVIAAGRFLQWLCLAGTASLLLQLALGAARRHFGSGHALVAHILWAIVAVFLIGWIAMSVMGLSSAPKAMIRFAKATGVLMAVQLALGGLAGLVTFAPASWPTWLVWVAPTVHVAVGALVLMTSVLLTVCAFHWVGSPIRRIEPAAVL